MVCAIINGPVDGSGGLAYGQVATSVKQEIVRCEPA